ncbi:MAG TPA: ABC transporter permease [Steroidobacteraceae bacterium]|nr:ABC transporter permease [Steroidobacteraceae bacterium]
MIGAGPARVALAVFAAQLRDRPLRLLVAVGAIALGVALAAAVYLVNESALAEFGRATRQLVGSADLVVRGGREGFDEALYARLAALPQVAIASPVLEREVSLAGGGTLPVLGVDPLLAGTLQPALYGDLVGNFVPLLAPTAIALSARAAESLSVAAGGTLQVQVGAERRTLEVVAVLPESAYGRRLGLMDIGAAQWTLGALGRLSRLDLRLRPGVDAARFGAGLALPAGVAAVTPEIAEARGASLSRAYRVNLDMLALVALLTGAFLVYATQALAVRRRRPQFALLRALGATRAELRLALIAEGALVGTAGGALGALLGVAVARLVLGAIGGDLGAGFFDGEQAAVAAGPAVLGAFVALGALVSVAGAWGPARAAAAVAPARALRAGDDEALAPARRRLPLAVGAALAGVALALGPPVRGLPLFGYASIALLLFAAVRLVPAFAGGVLARLGARRPVPALALAQLNGAVAQSAVSLAAIVVSFSLMVAMAIMVHSFRDSFERWLGEVLPADLYFRAAAGSDTAYLTPAAAARLAALEGVARLELRRLTQVSLAPEQPLVALIARPLAGSSAALPLVARAAAPNPGLPEVYASEAVRDLYGYRPGQVVALPIAGAPRRFFVAGIWRDYARSAGALAIERGVYEALAGEVRYTEGSLWLAPRADAATVSSRVRALLGADDALQLVEAGALKRRALAAFDRAFLITYALEAVAVAIGLLGVGLAFAMQSLARRAEFGMLRHLGLRRRDVLAMLSGEGAVLGALGALYGLAVGVALSLVLVYVVNRQSFHWSLDYRVPAGQLALTAAALVAAAALTAGLAGRVATSESAVRAVREDW